LTRTARRAAPATFAQRTGETDAADFTLSDARLFVARAQGFENWDRLIASVATPATDPRPAGQRL